MEYTANYSGTVPPEAGMAMFGGMMLVMFVVFGILYLYSAFTLMKIAQKLNVANAWLAWIPIIQVVPMLEAAQKPIWWIILLLIPGVNLVISVLVWMEISKRLGKPEWLGILMLISPINLILMGYYAFSSSAQMQEQAVDAK